MVIYKLNQHESESEPSSVTLDKGNGHYICIPFVADNTDYQEFLKWKTDGGVPDAAD